MPLLCEQHLHIIQKLPSGTYVCVQCGMAFREHHEIVVHVGASSQTE